MLIDESPAHDAVADRLCTYEALLHRSSCHNKAALFRLSSVVSSLSQSLRIMLMPQDYLAVAMEYADGGDLSEYIDSQYSKGVSELTVRSSALWTQRIAAAHATG